MIKVSGEGDPFINTFGAIETRTLGQGEEVIVDNSHLVGFSSSCRYEVAKFGSLKSTPLSCEGFVTHIHGSGEIFIQTKNPSEFMDWIWTLIEPRVRSTAR